MIFSNNTFKHLSFQQNPLRKPVKKLSFINITGLKAVSFSDLTCLKSVTLLKKMNPFTMNPFLP